MKKNLLLLGGLRYLIPVIKSAQKLGLHVITCDNLPNNIAHKFSNQYQNASIIDKEAILKIAKSLKIYGIMSFAVDPGVTTAAYVANKLGLPSIPYKSSLILQDKGLFREFLKNNNFNVPTAKSYSKNNFSHDELSQFNWPVIVKPVDSAGSKGVTKVENKNEIMHAISTALSHSISKNFIIEDFIEQKGYSSDTDCFSVSGKMEFFSFNNQYFDKNSINPYTPSAYSYPSKISQNNIKILKSELQRLIELLDLGTSLYNIEVREDKKGVPYIMEVSPRGGGNRLSEMVQYSYGVDLITNSIKAAIGNKSFNLNQDAKCNGYWAEVILHSNKSGSFVNLDIDEKIKKNHMVEIDLWIQSGDFINEFNGANDTIGTLILKFDSQNQMDKILSTQSDWLEIIIN